MPPLDPDQHGAFVDGVFPDARQTLLLRAALLSGDAALDAWHRWRATAAPGSPLDLASQRTLPLLYRNLGDRIADDSWAPQLKHAYRTAWFKNQRLMHELGRVVRLLHDASVPTLLLKGSMLIPLHYRDPGTRPMGDIDVLVPSARAKDVIRFLVSNGWETAVDIDESDLLDRQARPLIGPTGIELDLHWHALIECCQDSDDDLFWAGAVPVEINGARTLALNPADALFHVIIHGMRWNHVPSFRWIADAATIIRSAGAIEWDRLALQGRSRLLTLRLETALRFLRDQLAIPVPDSVLHTMRGTKISRTERLEYRLIMETQVEKDRRLLGSAFPHYVVDYLRARRDAGWVARALGFPRYLRRRYRVQGYSQLACLLAGKLSKKPREALAPDRIGSRDRAA